MDGRRGRKGQSACHLKFLEFPLTSFEFLRLPLHHSSVVNHPHGIVFDGGILVAAVVECPVLCLFALHFDEVLIFALGLGNGVGF